MYDFGQTGGVRIADDKDPVASVAPAAAVGVCAATATQASSTGRTAIMMKRPMPCEVPNNDMRSS